VKERIDMLLDHEVKSGEIYVNDKDFVIFDDEKISLWQLIKNPENTKTQPIWENVFTGELVNWGTHCFITIERIKRQYANIDRLTKNKRAEFVRDAMSVIEEYENMQKEQLV
jgi:hypothetical protein